MSRKCSLRLACVALAAVLVSTACAPGAPSAPDDTVKAMERVSGVSNVKVTRVQWDETLDPEKYHYDATFTISSRAPADLERALRAWVDNTTANGLRAKPGALVVTGPALQLRLPVNVDAEGAVATAQLVTEAVQEIQGSPDRDLVRKWSVLARASGDYCASIAGLSLPTGSRVSANDGSGYQTCRS